VIGARGGNGKRKTLLPSRFVNGRLRGFPLFNQAGRRSVEGAGMTWLDNLGSVLRRSSKSEDETPVFRILVLGTRRAGKTVFLASLYNKLCVYDPLQQYYLSCEHLEQQRDLQLIYQKLVNFGVWPLGTPTVTHYSFLARHVLPDGAATLFKVIYVDYPGGHIDELLRDTSGFSVTEAVRKCDSILVLLDGRKVRDLLDGRNDTIFNDLHLLLPIVNLCIDGINSKPVHFAITKSDLIDHEKWTLGGIRDKLLEKNILRNLVTTLVGPPGGGKNSFVSLIPVSSVGDDFAVYDPDAPPEENMKKRIGGVANPYNVQLSIGMTISDSLLMLYDSIKDKLPEIQKYLERNKRWKSWARAGEYLTTPLHFIPGAHVPFLVAETWMDKKVHRIEEIMKGANDRSSALDAVIRLQTQNSREFRKKFPGSDLRKAVLRKAVT
jgi:Double-GTPase 2